MDSFYSDDHIAQNHIHMDIRTCNVEEPHHKYCLGMVSNNSLEGLKLVLFVSPVKRKRDICIAFPAASLLSAAVVAA